MLLLRKARLHGILCFSFLSKSFSRIRTSERQMLFLAIATVLWGLDRLCGIFLIVLTLRNSDLGGAEGVRRERGRGLCVDLEREMGVIWSFFIFEVTQSCWRNILCLILKFYV